MVRYVSGGVRESVSNKLSNIFFMLDENNKPTEKYILVSRKKYTNIPIGWIVNIDETTDGKLKGFTPVSKVIKDSNIAEFEKLEDENIINTYKVNSAMSKQTHDIGLLRAKQANIKNSIEDMTIREIKETLLKNGNGKNWLRYYLMELL